MRETLNQGLEKAVTFLREYFAKMPRNSKIRLAVLSSAVLVLAIALVAFLNRTIWVPLPGSGDATNNNAIYEVLIELNIPTKTSGDIIEVPQDRLEEAQRNLRARNVMSASSFDDYYLSQAAGFGVSTEHARVLYDKQLGDDIRIQLLQNPRVQSALVTVKSGESSPFRIATNTRQATANVQIILRDGGMLEESEVQGITDLVKGSVPGIEYENIAITDQDFNSYSILRFADDSAEDSFEVEFDLRIALENRLSQQAKEQAEQLLRPIFGEQNLGIEAYVKLNFDKITETSVVFEPPVPGSEDGIIRSSERIFEMARRLEDAEGIPGTDPNGMGAVEYPYGAEGDEYYRKEVENLNFEINETRRAIDHAQGVIEDFSIGVAINSQYLGEEIEVIEYVEEVRELVARAVGVNMDYVAVYYIPFGYVDTSVEDAIAAREEYEEQRRRENLRDTILRYGTLILFFIMIYLLGREITKALRPPPEPEMVLMADGPGMGLDMIIGDDIIDKAEAIEQKEEELPEIDLNVKTASLEQIEKFIDKDAALVTQMLRNWIGDD